jgi:hypothetical protein
MRCTRVEKFLPLHVAGDLAGRRAERHVARHLATCERCRELAAEYDASRGLVRDAATLPPDFDGEFYAGIRRSVLDEIARQHTRLAPPPAPSVFAPLFNMRFNMRFAYAASLVLIVAAVAALSLYSYVGRKPDIANVNREHIGTPGATPVPTRTTASNDGRSVDPGEETLAEAKSKESRQTAKPLSLPRRVNSSSSNGNAQNETQRSLNLVKDAPARVRRNPPAPSVAAPDVQTAEIANNSNGVATNAAPEVSRIEIQTSDPNIRIIWLSPRPDAVTEPLK